MDALAPLLGRTLVIVAHPDDETIGCGGLLQRMREPAVVFCTDGAPRDHYFWAKYSSREAYAALRRKEALKALGIIGVDRVEFLPLPGKSEPFVDQDLFLAIPKATEKISVLVDQYRPTALLTHAYEVGHPDHDTCCFMVSGIAAERGLPVWEFPLYHRGRGEAIRWQEFLVPNGTEVLLDITPQELERKQNMLAVYRSQGEMLAAFFQLGVERFRPLAGYDFSLPPHEGILNYEAWQWSMTGAQVSAAFAACLQKRSSPEPEAPGPGVREVA